VLENGVDVVVVLLHQAHELEELAGGDLAVEVRVHGPHQRVQLE
jgi:hypothetical protein